MLINTKNTKRAFPNLKIGSLKLRKSTFSELYISDLEELLKNKLCQIIHYDDEYVIFFYAKNSFNTKYELFLNCFPNRGIITHSIDELGEYWRNIFFDGIEKSQEAIKELITENDTETQY